MQEPPHSNPGTIMPVDWYWMQQVLFPILGMGMATYFGTLIFKTIHKVIDRKHAGSVASNDLVELRSAVEDLQTEVRYGLADIQERLDFTERALTSRGPTRPEEPPAT